jgi:DNA-binding MarR family transcriptional regulator
MHTVVNEMKRAYWRSHVMVAPVARRHGLTPARYDMLLAIAQSPGRVMLNSDLRERVGCTPGVVSRMVRALEELGLVECERDRREKGSFFVGITAAGVERLRGVIAELDAGGVELAIETVVCENWWAPESREQDPRELATRLRRVRQRRGDHGRIAYEAPIAPEATDRRRAHWAARWREMGMLAERRRLRRNAMERRRRMKRGIEEARDLLLPGLSQPPTEVKLELLPMIPYRGKDSMLFRAMHSEAIPWDTGAFDPDDPLINYIEVPEGIEQGDQEIRID